MTTFNYPNTPQLDDAERAEAEWRVRALLTRYEDATPLTSVAERVRERLAAPETSEAPAETPRWRPIPRIRAPHSQGDWARGAVGLGLVAALLAGFVGIAGLRFGWFARVGSHGAAHGQCVMVVDSSHHAQPCPAQNIEAHMTVTRSYADPTRTVVEVRIATPGARIPLGTTGASARPDALRIMTAFVQDAQGRVYPIAEAFSPSYQRMLRVIPYLPEQDVAMGVFGFESLPRSALSAPQTLTLHITEMVLLLNDERGDMHLAAQWATPFQVTPLAGRAILPQVAPQTHHGVTLQPIELDISPNTSVFDGRGGGERLILRISGLPASTQISAMSYYLYGARDVDRLLLQGQSLVAIMGVPLVTAADPNPVVGPSGALTLELIFIPSPSQQAGVQTLSLAQLVIAMDQQSAAVTKTVKGPWTFALPLG